MNIFTSAAPNYYPKVAVLFESLKKIHPDWVRNWLVIEKKENFDKQKFEMDELVDNYIFLDDLNAYSEKWTFGNNIEEMCTAAKPVLVQQMFKEKKWDQILYFDPDMVLFSDVSELKENFSTNSILLTPHLSKPEKTLEAVLDNELCSLKHGVFNLGFFGIKNDDQGSAFTDWWAERLMTFCHADLSRGVWTDQKWINFAPVFFERVKILKDGRFNLAPWNIGQRNTDGSLETGINVEGKPLGFYHFTGFDSGMHEIMLRKYSDKENPVLELPNWYKQETKRFIKETPMWSLSFYTSGEEISSKSRMIFKDSSFDIESREDSPYSKSNEYFQRP